WERTQVAEPHGTGIPCRDQADKEAEDVRRIFNCSEIFPRVLPEDVFGRHRPQRLAEVLSIPAGREEAIAKERVQQVREHNDIPIPAKLVTSLKAWKAKAEKFCGLVFPTAGCSPKLNFLDDLKVVVERANLDKENFWLHKFRATFATWHLWNSVDLRTVQMWLGHSDMESTMRYLKPSRSQAVRDRVDSTFGGEQ